MPTKRRHIGRPFVPDAPAWVFSHFLTYGQIDGWDQDGGFAWWLNTNLQQDDTRATMRALWTATGPDILHAWIRAHPGSRPFGWWAFQAPRGRWPEDVPFNEPWWIERYSIQRQRLGGSGQAVRDQRDPRGHGGFYDSGAFGLPTEWDRATLDPTTHPCSSRSRPACCAMAC